MTARLFCRVGELAGADYEIGDEATIGRSSANAIVLGTGLVSSRHARIYRDADRGGYFVEDLGSLNGTRLDGVALGRPERLGELAVVTFAGALDFIFQDLDALPRRAAEASDEPRTMIEHEPILPPELLAGPGARSGPAEAPTRPPFAGTMIERDIPVLPGALAPEPGPGGAEGRGGSEGTHVDDEPIGLPAALAAEAAELSPEPAAPLSGSSAPAPESAAPSPDSSEPASEPAAPTPDSASPTPAPAAPPPTAEETAAAPGPRFVLEMPAPGGEVRRFVLRPGENVVGRLGDCDIKLDDPSISRHHAVVTLTGDRVTVRDLGSTNRTFLGDDPIEGEVDLSVGTEVRIGAVPARLVEE